jgi:hypothetical protein
LSTRKKGLVEALSWKAIASAIVAVLGLWFGIPEYVYNARPALTAGIGSGPVWFIEGAITGASTVLLVLKLFSQFSSRTEVTEKQGSNLRQLKKRIREELRILRDQINLDLQNNNLQGRTYQMDAFQTLKTDLVLRLDNAVFREINETYDKINGLQYSANLKDISVRKYQEAIRSIDKSLDRLK